MTEVQVRTVKVMVNEFPFCEMNDCKEEAHYDAKTVLGPWAFLCENHFEQLGTGLGLGQGQKMELINNK